MRAADVDVAISGYVLVGGASSRLGRDKVLLPFFEAAGTFLHHAIARLQQVCETVSVCGNRSDLRECLPPSMKIIPDAIAGCGPLGGIVAALESSRTDWNLLLAVDMPFVPIEILQHLVATATDIRGPESRARCILPVVDELPQPLCAMYRRSLSPGLRRALEAGTYKIMHALHDASESTSPQEPLLDSAADDDTPSPRNTAEISFLDMNAVIPPSGPNGIDPKSWFLNINTEADLLRARELMRDECH